MSHSIWKKYGFAWVTGGFFVLSLAGHWIFGWFTYMDEQTQHGASIVVSGYVMQMARDTLENWQSEFLQLVWQVVGLAYLYYAGSPQSRGDEERLEGKLDALLRKVDPDSAERLIKDLEVQYPRR